MLGAGTMFSAWAQTGATDVGRGKTILLDAWFNSQQHKQADGRTAYFHYKWEDEDDSGFSMLGQTFRGYGAETQTLYSAPTLEKLRVAQVYIIVSPDNASTNPQPNSIRPHDAEQVAKWVSQGGVLALMANDPAHTDLAGMNLMANRFGIRFNDEMAHHVEGDRIESGRIAVGAGGPVFHNAHTLYMKDTCTLSVNGPAASLVTDKGQIVMAVARYGKGTVFAVVDPWLYNEYVSGKHLPSEYDNGAAGEEWARWLLEQIPGR